jgi:hypothetical protein
MMDYLLMPSIFSSSLIIIISDFQQEEINIILQRAILGGLGVCLELEVMG